jgi:hypothetical protein
MAYARIVTIGNGTVIKKVRLEAGQSTDAVDSIAAVLSSIIVEEQHILKVEVDYTGCNNEDVITRYDP